MSNNSFRTSDDDAWRNNVSSNYFKIIKIQHPQNDILIGLNKIDIGIGANVRIKTYIDNVLPLDPKDKDAGFRANVNLESWADTWFYGAGCSWFDPSNHGDSDKIQWGTVSSGQMFTEKPQTVSFPHSFPNNPPNVVVWIGGLDVDACDNTRVDALVADVTNHGFTLNMRTWSLSQVLDMQINWIAVSNDHPSVRVGQFSSTTDGRAPKLGKDKTGYTAKLDFSQAFDQPPRVVVGFNKIDVWKERNLRIEANADKVTNTGFEMVISSWADTVLFGGGASYIAFI